MESIDAIPTQSVELMAATHNRALLADDIGPQKEYIPNYILTVLEPAQPFLELKMSDKSNPHYPGTVLSFKRSVSNDHPGMMIIPPKVHNIVWGGDNRYWNIPMQEDQPAELYQVSWLEVTGSVTKIDSRKNYEVGFKISFTPDAFGWSNSPVFIMVKRGRQGKFAWKKQILDSNRTDEHDFTTILKKMENSSADPDLNTLYYGLYEVWSGKWKGGLKLHHAFIKELE